MKQPAAANAHGDRATQLSIRQQNLNKSLVAQSDFLHQLDPAAYDPGAIQEPYLDHHHNSRATHHWYTVYPNQHYTLHQPRKNQIDPASQWADSS